MKRIYLGFFGWLIFPLWSAAQTLDPLLPSYQKVSGISGKLDSIGSDTLNNMMTLWSEAFQAMYPQVHIQVEGKGSSTAPPALISGTAQLGPMSRKMKDSEIQPFEKKYGFKPTAIGIALDSLAVYVHKDNPLSELTLPQVDALFSKTRLGRFPIPIVTWGDLGLTGKWKNFPVSLYGRNSASGTYGYFKEVALYKGDYKDTVKEQPGSASVVLGVTEDLGGVGYSGMGYHTSGVKALALSRKAGAPAYEPTYENLIQRKYPLGRMLWIYVALPPGSSLPPVIQEFLKFILSKEGQAIVIKDGYLPLTAAMAEKQRNSL